MTNRHSLLVDLERGELAKWWIGDTARELTRGKSWYWQLGGQPLTGKLESLVSFRWQDASGQLWQPMTREQFVIEFDRLQHTPLGIRWQGRLLFAREDQQRTIPIECTIEPHLARDGASDQSTGIDVQFAVTIPVGSAWIVDVGPLASQLRASDNEQRYSTVIDAKTNLSVHTAGKQLGLTDTRQIKITGQAIEPTRFTVELRSEWPVDQVPLDIQPLSTTTSATATSSTKPNVNDSNR